MGYEEKDGKEEVIKKMKEIFLKNMEKSLNLQIQQKLFQYILLKKMILCLKKQATFLKILNCLIKRL